jgi:hypothetical protein
MRRSSRNFRNELRRHSTVNERRERHAIDGRGGAAEVGSAACVVAHAERESMSNKRKGQLTVSGEWARHLRPLLRRAFWKGERQAGGVYARKERDALDRSDRVRGDDLGD